MRMYDLISAKKAGNALSADQLHFWIQGIVRGEIPDYLSTALLMAICWRGLSAEETAVLTDEMANSGDVADLSAVEGIKADKHSTGGVGDKTTLVTAPIAAACGLKIAKMSGRGLGHTGGTIDKLEAIPGFQTVLSPTRFSDIVRKTGLCVIAQSSNIAPADKILYALRDVTATVDNLSLIASSIMSKKLASGADVLVLDVKTGSGAFMKTMSDAAALAREMVDIGVRHGRKVEALITDMDRPLGRAVGNAIEVREAIETLKGNGPSDLTALSLSLAASLLTLAGYGSREACFAKATQALQSGAALGKWKEMIRAQGGDDSVTEHPERLPLAPLSKVLYATDSGYLTAINTEAVGLACTALGAGRAKKGDPIDSAAGLYLHKTVGETVHAGDPLMTLYASSDARLADAEERLRESITLGKTPPPARPLIAARVTKDGTDLF